MATTHASFIEVGFVESGAVLATIAPRDYELAVRRAMVGIRQAQATLLTLLYVPALYLIVDDTVRWINRRLGLSNVADERPCKK